MTEVADILEEIGLSQYLETFIEHGFDTWEAFADITEPDFDALGVKLGHRRKIQRKIANARGISAYQPLVSPAPNTPSDDRQSDESRSNVTKSDSKENVPTGKRKYRRHPKPDDNAPERPPSAYVIFSNKMRDDLKGQHLSFTEIAKLVGGNWQALSPVEKEPYELQATTAKDKYNTELTEYKTTESYMAYSRYLMEFKEKHQNQQQVSDAAKRPKLLNENSAGSSGVESSTASQHSSEAVVSHVRGGSVGSVGQTWYAGDPSQHPNYQHHNVTHNVPIAARVPGSPANITPNALPGFRDAIFGVGPQTAEWRENNARETDAPPIQQLPRILNMGDRISGQPGTSPTTFDGHGNMALTSSHTGSSFTSPPPLLTRDSTSTTSASSTSNNSSMYYPLTPLEPLLDRSLPMPGQMFSSKPPSVYDNQTQLSLRVSSSMSPKNPQPYTSPTTIPSIADLSMPRGYAPQSHPPAVKLPSVNHRSAAEEETLDPVSALLRADEIVSGQAPRR